MSWTRTHVALVGLLAVQVVLIAALNWPGTGRYAATEPQPWLSGVETEEVDRIVVEDDQGDRVELAVEEGRWVLPDRDGFPADESKVRELLDELAGIEVRAPVVQQAKFHESLEVAEDKFRHRVTLWGEGEDDPRAELLFGTSPQYQIHHARRAAEDAVYEVTGITVSDLRTAPSDWAVKTITEVEPDRVVRLQVRNGHGAFALEREPDRDWRVTEPEDQTGLALDQDAVGEIVSDLSDLTLAEPVGAIDEEEQGFAEPAARVTMAVAPPASSDDGDESSTGSSDQNPAGRAEEIIIRVGAEHPEESGQHYLTASTLEFATSVWTSRIRDILDAKLSDLSVEEDEGNDVEDE